VISEGVGVKNIYKEIVVGVDGATTPRFIVFVRGAKKHNGVKAVTERP
jgi:hypothetical protein